MGNAEGLSFPDKPGYFAPMRMKKQRKPLLSLQSLWSLHLNHFVLHVSHNINLSPLQSHTCNVSVKSSFSIQLKKLLFVYFLYSFYKLKRLKKKKKEVFLSDNSVIGGPEIFIYFSSLHLSVHHHLYGKLKYFSGKNS